MEEVYIKARGKVNLNLEILDKRQDNYNNLKSVFQKINLYDEMFIKKINNNKLELQTNIESLNNYDNIIYKAYEELKQRYRTITGISVVVNKRIPMQAGLGGGSTDCASFIIAINKLFDLNLTEQEIIDIVIIHDGARPMIKQEYINKCIESMDEFEGVTIGVKSKDTIKITDDNGIVISSTNRSNTWIVQTPQCFNRNTLLQMHQKYANEDATDDCGLLERDNYKIKMLEGDYTNIKITTYGDLNITKEFIGI